MKAVRVIALILTLFILAGCAGKKDLAESPAATEATGDRKVNDSANALLNPYPNAPVKEHTPVSTDQLISMEEAQTIALNHAGVTAEEVTGLHTSMDIDNGRQEYEVEFRVGHLEYEYEIDAATGTILSFDKDD